MQVVIGVALMRETLAQLRREFISAATMIGLI